MSIEYPKPSLEDYSVARDDTRYGTVYRVYRNNIYVAANMEYDDAIKLLGTRNLSKVVAA